ncbi:YcxB family protein [Terriglobus sp. 2YAB30_2]|uniref:YcxB family protein n=1 Tax=Terriglobus sp. 2YAB30_2 TaxID=3233023 RepID=UPI003F97C151
MTDAINIIRFRPTISFEQYRDTLQAVVAMKPKRVPKRSWPEYVILGVVCLAVGLSPQVPPIRVPTYTMVVVYVLYALFSGLLAKRTREKCLRAIFMEEEAGLNDQVLTIDESGIFSDRGNGQVTAHFAWSAFIKCIDMSDAYVFLPSPNGFVRVPKEPLSQAEVELLLRWSGATPNCER